MYYWSEGVTDETYVLINTAKNLAISIGEKNLKVYVFHIYSKN